MKTASLLVAVCAWIAVSADAPPPLNPKTMPVLGSVDSRFQAYNIEMLEVTGGRFWKPYRDLQSGTANPPAAGRGGTPAGVDPNLFEYRPPIDLRNLRLRKLAAALGPTYVRVSGTWANSTYFQDSDGPPPSAPPQGFNGVLTRGQWKGVIDFAHAANAEIVTSFATSAGTRNSQGVWTPDQARSWLAYTKSAGGKIAAAEFMNEPNLAAIGGAPRDYDAAAYARDIAVFLPFFRQAAPGALFLGPGSVMEGGPIAAPPGMSSISSESMLRATGPVFDVLSYHFYPAVSQRCAGMSTGMGATAGAALSDEWFSRSAGIEKFYASMRDRLLPGKPLWITETADSACGGNPWGSTFLDTFRYLDEHARLAQLGVKAIMHNTLAASDYGLLDEKTFAPRPNYWAALVWHRLMGTTVLDPGPPPSDEPHVYAHCLSGVPGGVALLAIHAGRTAPAVLTLPTPSERYTLTAKMLEDTTVLLNGRELRLGSDDAIPQFAAVRTPAGPVTLPPLSITFLALRGAENQNCR